jgi:hypothetical protein
VTVIDPDHLTHVVLKGHLSHNAIGRRLDRLSNPRRDINRFVEFPIAAEGG